MKAGVPVRKNFLNLLNILQGLEGIARLFDRDSFGSLLLNLGDGSADFYAADGSIR